MGDLPNRRYRDVKRHNDGLIVMGDLPMENQINVDEDFME